jgi:hypothetical protein
MALSKVEALFLTIPVALFGIFLFIDPHTTVWDQRTSGARILTIGWSDRELLAEEVDAAHTMQGVAAGDLTKEQLADWIAKHATAI